MISIDQQLILIWL